tara:strand:+ start:813 stop:1541 length:729 start_codon:yes stop_codon:yes gene_type:complete
MPPKSAAPSAAAAAAPSAAAAASSAAASSAAAAAPSAAASSAAASSAGPTSTLAVTLPNIDFTKGKYEALPYLNINADEENSIKLEELFEYQKLYIPDENGNEDDRYSILNIKKQFICVKFKKPSAPRGGPAGPEQSRIYVKRPVIQESLKDKLPLIKTDKNTTAADLTETIVFSGNSELKDITQNKKTTAGAELNQAVTIFEGVYKKLEPDERPFFAEVNNQFQGGNKRGGTRKVGGSRSR